MNLQDFIVGRKRHAPEFRAAREELCPEYEFRRALIGARLAVGLTQSELAAKIGTTQSAIARLESGEVMPKIDTLQRLATVLDVRFEIAPDAGLTVHVMAR